MNTCPQCGTDNPRVEVFGADDEDEIIYEYTCHECGYVWQETELDQLLRDSGG